MDDNSVAAFAVLCIFGLPTFAFIVIRMLQHRERIEMIRHGMAPPSPVGREYARTMQPPPRQRAVPIDNDDPQRTLRKGVVLTFIGLALTIGLASIGFLVDPPRFVPGPWLLGGLIPLFVGIAQVVTALMFGATFPGPAGARYGMGAEQMPPPPPSPPPPFEGSYAYRPDPSIPELQPPVQPPDRR
jgi:hypothetical protein